MVNEPNGIASDIDVNVNSQGAEEETDVIETNDVKSDEDPVKQWTMIYIGTDYMRLVHQVQNTL